MLYSISRSKNLIFNLKDFEIPISNHSSFIFNTYELNDRIILERNLSRKHKCIVIGGGIGSTMRFLITQMDYEFLKSLFIELS